ncbi:UDP-N-acetylglucosamine 1-carboxyvinyltransferase [Acutalibacter muris]|jgi:UDP-N-acetylglucosamine 1-carboxyvinyltransferase|uniref:UDP-N-acetylglucosamine 1-carboxyvinyltransferase n=1 Tax=Acutalibacter muris TaxID=1796620 RepID=A0A1Z2XT62_9FIRM|nr:UDP-N-acetylglucosamine 1-carboxyvinyltransferase [Acutalibacter muris]ANU55133.1 UDP-N-acetylglucosamine 1-carboxyvinyltransferase [Hungateiclostridiaceae bacterium KB18]ASB41633.1 UDP-N-acetylglucosamine 1-carboxyvinyltransferase [Acutalibacter muris]MCI9192159.1 UDP-N-acetylglucosamine 1-carboxyvinyltransferase [Acutalibacter muris]MCI9543425.1 UDP-N-acetylglucosamine 1-carboxyvinyltransferase [Acutalibacter muris]QQR30893.1 UDP-N-acetylglucosamine 1-carboxyvinyltransferase [Acutalibacte
MMIIDGPARLSGELSVQGAKNSTLPLLAGALLCKGQTVLHNCPDLSDVDTAIEILRHLGCVCRREGHDLIVDSSITCHEIPEELMRRMRSSIVFLGAILSRCKEARLCPPGGCELGPRPIDLHISSLRRLGVQVKECGGWLECSCPGGINGAYVSLSFPSVGATENLILAAVCGKGTTIIANAAREPEICDLSEYLNRCGGRIYGAGESCIIIDGVEELYGCEHRVMPDRIAAVTYMAAAAVTGGNVTLRDVDNTHILPMLSPFEESGCQVRQLGGSLNISAPRQLSAVRHIRTMPYPGFPTDAQPVVMSMAAVGEGTSVFVENIFENRYRHTEGLTRMGARIKVEGKVAVVEGVPELSGAAVEAADLRGGAALIVAGLCARGSTRIEGTEFVKRGYEDIGEKLALLGARVKVFESC